MFKQSRFLFSEIIVGEHIVKLLYNYAAMMLCHTIGPCHVWCTYRILHTACCMLYYIPHTGRYILHAIRYVSHTTYDIRHTTHYMLHPTYHCSTQQIHDVLMQHPDANADADVDAEAEAEADASANSMIWYAISQPLCTTTSQIRTLKRRPPPEHPPSPCRCLKLDMFFLVCFFLLLFSFVYVFFWFIFFCLKLDIFFCLCFLL